MIIEDGVMWWQWLLTVAAIFAGIGVLVWAIERWAR